MEIVEEGYEEGVDAAKKEVTQEQAAEEASQAELAGWDVHLFVPQVPTDGVHRYNPTNESRDKPTLREVEWAYVQQVLAATGGNKTEAARILGVDRRTLYRKLEKEEGRPQ